MTVGIEQFGDSTTQGLTLINGAVTLASASAPGQLYTDAGAEFPGSVIVYNRGVSATMASDLVNDPSSFDNMMATSTAQIVTFNYGMNESSYNTQRVESYALNMDILIRTAKKYGKIVVVMEPNPCTAPRNTNLAAYVKALNAIAKANSVVVVPHYQIWNDANLSGTFLSDGIHPNKDGYIFKGHTEFQFLRPIIKSLLGI